MKLNKVLVSAATLSGIVAATTAANADNVQVKAGDTVSELAEKYHTTIDEIQKANHLKDINFITVGQNLYIPTANDQADIQTEQTNVQQQNEQAQLAAQQAAAKKQAEINAQQAAAAKKQAEIAVQQAAAKKQAEINAQQAAAAKKQAEIAVQQ
ncbi:MAG TPA: LysM peptidoglycan-binding domain-containing protein, partial [Candidatus Ligilactobacillus excrementigallinarum]|nr:LysM peptidoglycan-binding domain-containing protein [Candidatus Ligilactobacillus excrementigallinarum]